MLVNLNFVELSDVLGYVETVLSDKAVDEKMKNVIFQVTEDSVSVVGYSPLMYSRTLLEKAVIEDYEEDWSFQVKLGELNKIINSFKTLSKTEVSDMSFCLEGVKIKVVVEETAKEGEDDRFSQVCKFLLDNVPIMGSIKKELNEGMPEDTEFVNSGDLLVYLNTLFPLISNDTSNSMVSQLHFADEYVFVISSTMSSYFKNKLPDTFKGITLGYSLVNFIRKVATASLDGINVAKTKKNICLDVGNTQAFMRYQRVKINHKPYVEKMSKETGVIVDRMYFKDVLRRMGSSTQDCFITIEDGSTVKVENDVFSQEIPVNGSVGEIENIKFKISVPLLEKAIIGDDGLFSGDIEIYLVPTAAGYALYIMDDMGVWFSYTQVRKRG